MKRFMLTYERKYETLYIVIIFTYLEKLYSITVALVLLHYYWIFSIAVTWSLGEVVEIQILIACVYQPLLNKFMHLLFYNWSADQGCTSLRNAM